MLNETVVQLVVRETRALFRPTFLRVETDTATTNHTRWTGRLRGDSAASSVLAFRWLLLLEAMVAFEAIRAQPFSFVLRLRPDALLSCKLPSSPLVMLGSYSAVIDKDVALLARREAATMGLSVYRIAATSELCAFKRELCVGAVLMHNGISVGAMKPGAVIVRPQALCPVFQSKAFALDSTVSCGREYLSRRSRYFCREPPQLWNLSRRVQYWRARGRGLRKTIVG
mmetsp:Transcript_2475/g.5398  ORF Transcript_2475/g.5398 Transcript_2475/m.5398 type:complete len:227 (-) Transcript_2475:261-941(-)